MAFDPNRHHRRSIRLPGYDYGQAGGYSVAICTRNRECTLGRVEGEDVALTKAGRVVMSLREGIPGRFPSLGLDAFAVMPNHIHAVFLVGAQFPSTALRTSIAPRKGVMNHAPTVARKVIQP